MAAHCVGSQRYLYEQFKESRSSVHPRRANSVMIDSLLPRWAAKGFSSRENRRLVPGIRREYTTRRPLSLPRLTASAPSKYLSSQASPYEMTTS